MTDSYPTDPKFSAENLNAMTKAMRKIVHDKDMSEERKLQMMDATFRLYMGEPTEPELELRRIIKAEIAVKDKGN